MTSKRKKYKNGIGLYDLNNNLLKSFDYASDLASYLNISKVTVSKYCATIKVWFININII